MPKRSTQVVLVVDADSSRRDFAREQLERAGYPVVTASRSDEAVELFSLVNIALVVTGSDDGLIRRMVADSKHKTVPVVLGDNINVELVGTVTSMSGRS